MATAIDTLEVLTTTPSYVETGVRTKKWRVTFGTLTTGESTDTGIDLKAGWLLLGIRMTVVQASDKGATTTIALDDGSSGTLLGASSVASTVAADTRYVGLGNLLGTVLATKVDVTADSVVASGPCVADTIVDIEVMYMCFSDVE